MMRPLFPPLQLVEDDLFGAAPDEALAPLASLAEPHAVYVAPAMPDFLQDLVNRRVASQQAFAPEPLAAGQIRRLDQVAAAQGTARVLGRACAILLGASLGADRWTGWLVTQESDYATDRDLVLQDQDGPLPPDAAMVQAWNPVECRLDSDAALLGKLAPERLAAVKMLSAARSAHDFVAPRPGRVGAWDLDANTTVVTGTPLGDIDDPRHAYQRLYLRLADELRLATQPVPAPALALPWLSGALDWLRHALVQPALTLGAVAVAILQGIWIFSPNDAPLYRSAAPAASAGCAALVRVTFSPDAGHANVLAAMRAAGAMFVDGPGDTGELLVRPGSGQDAGQLATKLRQHALVEQADAVPQDTQRCTSG